MPFDGVRMHWAAFGVLVILIGSPATAQESESTEPAKSADEIAKELSNPVGSMASMVFQGTQTHWGGSAPGATEQTSGSLVFLPTLPFKAWGGNLIVRPSFPVVGAPTMNPEGEWDKENGFGDMVIVTNWGKVTETGLLWSFGATTVLPTASKDLGKDQFQLGPAAILGLLKPWGVIGGFWQHWWGLNPAEGEEAVNVGNIQLFYWFGLGGGWQVGGSPIPTANYATAADTEITFPVNLGFAKTFMAGSTPIKATIQGQYFVTRPDVVGPDWGVFFQITPVIKVPW